MVFQIDHIKIANRSVGTGYPPLLIAEIAQAHDGSLGMAHAYIDAAAEAGADVVKFQTHIATQESTFDEVFRVKLNYQDLSRYDYWKRMEFSLDQWKSLSLHAKDRGLIFLSSAFSAAAIELLEKVGVPAWKVGSGEFRSTELLEAMMKTGKPILVSTGMSSWSEIDTCVNLLKGKKYPFALLQCTSRYPTPLKSVGINMLDEFRHRYLCPIGLSDHSGKIFPSLLAMARGAEIIEVHITFDRRMFGADVSSSLTIDELALLAKARDEFFEITSNPVNKDKISQNLTDMRALFSKSIAPRQKLRAGDILTEEMLIPKKPGSGIPYNKRAQVVGKRLIKDITPERLLSWEDIEEQA